MSDKNIEIIKTIQATGKCSETATVRPTKMIMEGLEANPNTEIRSTKTVFNAADENKDN